MLHTMNLTPKEIVHQLDRYIIGQADAKRSVAIALRNRYRRGQVDESIREEITPKNIIMIGPTGVGKTEIARRLAKLVHAPFVKVEATKFTEVGYVGRDVESIIRDLVEAAIRMVKNEKMEMVKEKAAFAAEERLLDALLPPKKKKAFEKKILDNMVNQNIHSVNVAGLQLTRSDISVRKTLDATKIKEYFKVNNTDINPFIKTSTTDAKVTITVKGTK